MLIVIKQAGEKNIIGKKLCKFTVYHNPDIIDTTSLSLGWSGPWLHIANTIIV